MAIRESEKYVREYEFVVDRGEVVVCLNCLWFDNKAGNHLPENEGYCMENGKTIRHGGDVGCKSFCLKDSFELPLYLLGPDSLYAKRDYYEGPDSFNAIKEYEDFIEKHQKHLIYIKQTIQKKDE